MAFDSLDPALHDGEARKGEFRERARDILAKDRDARKFGRSVNTAGTIVQAMESAYKLGLAHGRSEGPPPAGWREGLAGADDAIPWNSIPPRPRSAFESILRYRWLAIEVHVAFGHMKVDEVRCYWDLGDGTSQAKRFEVARTFSLRTLAPLLRIGLLEARQLENDANKVYAPTQRALATWAKAVAEGHIRERD